MLQEVCYLSLTGMRPLVEESPLEDEKEQAQWVAAVMAAAGGIWKRVNWKTLGQGCFLLLLFIIASK